MEGIESYRPLGDEWLEMSPDFGPDAVHQLLVHLAQHHGDRARVEAGDTALFKITAVK